MSTPRHIQVFACLAILAIAIQVNSTAFSILLFKLNRSQISQTECERKMPHCNGHCYLMKQLAKTGNNENGSRSTVRETHIDEHYLPQPLNNLTALPFSEVTINKSLSDQTSSGWPFAVLQPPRA